MAEGDWYYTVSAQQTGPVALQTLQVMASTGQLSRTDLVWTDGMANWQAAGTVAALYGKSATAAPRPTPVTATPVNAQQLNYGGYQQPQGAYGRASFAADAKSALMYSILGFLCLGFVFGPMAISKASKAKAAMAVSGNFDGAGMATAATIIGWIVTILSILAIIGRIAMFSMHR